jgi:Coenzyme PQQ synthesis protein D (PqqD)
VILAKSPETAWRVIEGEAMILSLDDKVFRGLNSVGSRVWELIDGRRSVDEIVSQIVGEFEVTPEVAHRDVGTFVAELLEKRLVTSTPP